MKQLIHSFEGIICVNNLLEAWEEFIIDKKYKKDVEIFSLNLMDNILLLHDDLLSLVFEHGGYEEFSISDPKPRIIHKASVRDRLVHHAIYRSLFFYFDKVFIVDSYSCRINKGPYKAIKRFKSFFYKVSKNNHKSCWVLKGDIRKFFANIDQEVLIGILDERILDKNIMWLLKEVIYSFHSTRIGLGLPLGNLTSQLFANIYMNGFDQYMKHELKVQYFIRYADDFVILSQNKKWLEEVLLKIREFLLINLKLELHPNKVSIKTLTSGIDFLGWVNFADHQVLRTATKNRMLRRLTSNPSDGTVNSYLGLLGHGNTRKIKEGYFGG